MLIEAAPLTRIESVTKARCNARASKQKSRSAGFWIVLVAFDLAHGHILSLSLHGGIEDALPLSRPCVNFPSGN